MDGYLRHGLLNTCDGDRVISSAMQILIPNAVYIGVSTPICVHGLQ